MWVGAVVMVVSGIFVFLNDPIRYYNNIFFRIKAVMLVLAVLNAWVFQNGTFRRIADWDRGARAPATARMAGLASIVLWAGIVIAGRMIAYNWFDKK
jgi:O-antigen/teichoic acid export membrane protein